MSTSKMKVFALGHAENVLLYITASPGTSGIELGDFSMFGIEDEVLFDQDQEMTISGAELIAKETLPKELYEEQKENAKSVIQKRN